MSELDVQRVIGLLVSDEGLRRRFRKNPRAALMEMVERGIDLTDGEVRSLSVPDFRELTRYAEEMMPPLSRVHLEEGAS